MVGQLELGNQIQNPHTGTLIGPSQVKSLGVVAVGIDFEANPLMALAIEIDTRVIQGKILRSPAVRGIATFNGIVTGTQASTDAQRSVGAPVEFDFTGPLGVTALRRLGLFTLGLLGR